MFLEQRLHTFLARNCEWGFENTPSLSELLIDDDDEDADDTSDGDFRLGG